MCSSEAPLITFKEDKIGFLVLNRPHVYNAWSYDIYDILNPKLEEFDADPEIQAIILTGKGKYFTAGNDLKKNITIPAKKHVDRIEACVSRLIDMKKLFIGAINGPGVGVGTTILGLMDYVVASREAFFTAPFTQLGICPEFCSSYTFPKAIGNLRSIEIFVGGKRLSVEEAKEWGLVSRIIDKSSEDEFLQSVVKIVNELLLKSTAPALLECKSLVRNQETKDMMHVVNKRECQGLIKLFCTPEADKIARDFLHRKSKKT